MPTDTLSRTFAAIADPTRRAMLARLSRGTATVNELAEPFDLALPTISKHLKVLERAELVERSREAQFRPVTLRPERLAEVTAWVEQLREAFAANYDRLDLVLEELKASAPKTASSRRRKQDPR